MRDERRRDLLWRYLREACGGDRAALIERSGLTKGRISQMLAEGFGERAGRDLAQRLGLPAEFFDRAHAAPSAPAGTVRDAGEASVLRRWRGLTADQRGEVLDHMDELLARNRAAWAQLKAIGYDEALPAEESPPPAVPGTNGGDAPPCKGRH
jgi:hypothetical protein